MAGTAPGPGEGRGLRSGAQARTVGPVGAERRAAEYLVCEWASWSSGGRGRPGKDEIGAEHIPRPGVPALRGAVSAAPYGGREDQRGQIIASRGHAQRDRPLLLDQVGASGSVG